MTIIETALHYKNDLGFVVVPQKNKQPICLWSNYQDKFPTDEEIVKWWTDNPDAGISAVVGSISKVIVIDCDSLEAIDETEKQIPDSLIVPCAETPRGGRHYYFSCQDKIQKKVGFRPQTDLQAESSTIVMPPSKGKNGNSYKWIVEPKTKNDFPAIPASLQASILNNKYIKKEKDFVNSQTLNNVKDVKDCYIYASEGIRNEALYHAVHLLKYGSATPDEINIILKILAKSCNPEYPEKELPTIIESALKREARRKRNIAQEVRDWSLLIEDEFLLKDCYLELKIVNSEDQLSTRVALNKLCVDKVLEKGKARGSYRPIKRTELEKMTFIEGKVFEFPIVLPLDLNKMCRLYPKNIVIIAGSKSSGKTAMAMTIAVANQNNIPVVYFNSEMGDEEYSERMKNFGIRKADEIKFNMYPLKENYQDYITDEKKIFIVDFLEVHENFYEVAKPIRKIHDNLKDGICIVCLQMKPGSTSGGVGGMFSQEKARLYLTMEYNNAMRGTKVGIYDAKSPKTELGFEDGIRGMFRHIKIINGSQISAIDNWRR